jgi:hypothetical protein
MCLHPHSTVNPARMLIHKCVACNGCPRAIHLCTTVMHPNRVLTITYQHVTAVSRAATLHMTCQQVRQASFGALFPSRISAEAQPLSVLPIPDLVQLVNLASVSPRVGSSWTNLASNRCLMSRLLAKCCALCEPASVCGMCGACCTKIADGLDTPRLSGSMQRLCGV